MTISFRHTKCKKNTGRPLRDVHCVHTVGSMRKDLDMPKMEGLAMRMKTISPRLAEDVAEALRRVSRATGMKQEALVELCLREGLPRIEARLAAALRPEPDAEPA